MKKIFIGYILIFFHLKINGFDLLPDFIGYALIVSGLGQMPEDSEYFVKAKPCGVVLAIVSAFYCITEVFGFSASPVVLVVNLIFTGISLYLMYLIGHGVRETEQRRDIDMGGEKFISLWKAQAGLTITCQVLTLVPYGVIVIVVTILLIAAMVTNIVFLVYLYRAKKALEDDVVDCGAF